MIVITINSTNLIYLLAVNNGEIVALGGLLDDNERRTLEKIPLLGDIPGLGQLFRSKSKSRTKTNLVVFIRPTIVRTAAEAQAIAARRYGYARDTQLLFNPEREPTLDELVRDYIGTTPPVVPAAGPEDQILAPEPTTVQPTMGSTTVHPIDIPPSQPPSEQRP